MKMKAAVLEELNKIVVKDVELPQVDNESILIKVKTCAVCGSDIRIFHSGNPRVKPPQIIGHEAAGEIVEIGKNVRGFKKGDRIAIGADVPCGKCYYCQNGMGNNCLINYAIGYQFPGAYAEYMLLNETTVKFGPVHRIPDNVSYEEASLAEPLACCINGIEISQVKLGDTVVIIGAGPVGCMLSQLAKISGAKKVIVSQRSPKRLEIAKKFGADVLIGTAGDEFIKRVLEETNNEGADVIFTACSSKEAQQNSLKIVRHKGRINFFGGLAKNNSEITIDSNIIHYLECRLEGSHGSTPRQHKLALDLISTKQINVKDLISDRFKLFQIKEAFALAESHAGMKVIIEC